MAGACCTSQRRLARGQHASGCCRASWESVVSAHQWSHNAFTTAEKNALPEPASEHCEKIDMQGRLVQIRRYHVTALHRDGTEKESKSVKLLPDG